MTTCERCGNAIPDTAAICPSCGTISPFARSGQTPPTNYEPSNYAQGYNPPPSGYNPPPSGYNPAPNYNPPSAYPPQQVYAQPAYTPPPSAYPPVAVNINMSPAATPTPSVNNGAIIVEVLLNLFLGIYGVGWLMAGETTAGIILLVCSILFYWPIMIVGVIFTLGIGLICLGPLAIGAIILNAVLLNNNLKRKIAYVLVQPPIQQSMPPR